MSRHRAEVPPYFTPLPPEGADLTTTRVTFDSGHADVTTFDLAVVAAAQGLLLIDPLRDHRAVWEAIRNTGHDCPPTVVIRSALAGMLPAPEPEPMPEPGTWGVVVASCVHDDERREWVRHPDGNWWPAPAYSDLTDRRGRDYYLPDDWDSLADPFLIREGLA